MGTDKKEYLRKITSAALNPAWYVIAMPCIYLLGCFPVFGEYVMRVGKILPAWALLIILCNLMKYKKFILESYRWILVLFCISYGITICINYKYNFFSNTKSLIWIIIYVCVLMTWWRLEPEGREGVLKKVRILNYAVVGINMLNVVPTFFFYILGKGFFYGARPIGIYGTRMYGITEELNPSTMVAFISVIVSFINMDLKGKKPVFEKAIYIVNLLCTYVFIITSGTRATRFAMIAVFTYYFFLFLLKRQDWSVKKNHVKSVVKIIGGSLLFIIAFYFTVEATRYPIGKFPSLCRSAYNHVQAWVLDLRGVEDIPDISDKTDEPSDAGLKEDEVLMRAWQSENSATGARLDIAKEGIALWTDYKIFGIGSANIKVYAQQNGKEYVNVITGTHSMPLSCLLFSGAIGLILFMAYLISRMLSAFIGIIRGETVICWKVKKHAFAICMALCIYSMGASVIVFNNARNTVLFWIYLGIMEMAEAYSAADL